MSEVQVGSGLVTEVHRLVESALGIISVEDDAVKGNADDFNDNLNDDANEGPVLAGIVSLRCPSPGKAEKSGYGGELT